MNRRDWLVGAGAVALAAATKAAATEKVAQERNPLIDTTYDCQKKAETCLTHCMTMLAGGDTSMAACAAAARNAIATSRALASLASANSKHTKDLAQVCAAVCKECEAECRKHQAKMTVCRECADACERMIQEVARLA